MLGAYAVLSPVTSRASSKLEAGTCGKWAVWLHCRAVLMLTNPLEPQAAWLGKCLRRLAEGLQAEIPV